VPETALIAIGTSPSFSLRWRAVTVIAFSFVSSPGAVVSGAAAAGAWAASAAKADVVASKAAASAEIDAEAVTKRMN
jgi:hypothetical protein